MSNYTARNSTLYCGNGESSSSEDVYIYSYIHKSSSEDVYIYSYIHKDIEYYYITQTENWSSSNYHCRKCLDICGYIRGDYRYRENDNVIWWYLDDKWNQSWKLENTAINNSFYIKSSNNDLYLCYGENDTKFLSRESPNRIILKK
jgi:hypothetical protein